MTADQRRAACPECKRPDVRVNKDGRFRQHRYVMDSQLFAPCPESGTPAPPEDTELDRDLAT